MIIPPIARRGDKAFIPQPPAKNSKRQQNNRSVVLEVLAGLKGEPQLAISQHNVSWQDLKLPLITRRSSPAAQATALTG